MVGIKKIYILAFLVALITILVYLPTLQNDFVNWDDHKYIYENPYIQSIGFESLKWMFTTFHASNWHPLTWLSHAIDYAIWGLNPMGHHLTSIIFHGLNTFLVVILIIRLIMLSTYAVKQNTSEYSGTGQIRNQLIAGAITGLLFGLHPLHVESVAWVSERKDVLYAFFFLLSILSYLKYTSSLHPFDKLRARGGYYGLCLLFFILSLMSKPMAVTLPVVLIILDFYPLERLGLKFVFTSQRKVLIEKLPFMVLSLASSVVTVMAQQAGGAIQSLVKHPLGERVLVGIKALYFYLVKMLWPTDLAPFYPYPSKISIFAIEYMGTFILVSGITAFCIYSWRKQKIWSAVWAFYIMTLLPVLGIIQVGGQAAADRYTYLPSLGPFLLVGLAATSIWKRTNIKQYVPTYIKLSFLISLLLIIGIISTITVKQISIWKDSLTLWNTELKMFPTDRVYKSRGQAYSDLGNYNQAIIDYDKAIKLNPLYTEAYLNRGTAYAKSGNYQKAIEDYNMAIIINPDDTKAYINRGIYYAKSGKYQQAVKDFDTAIRLDSQYIKAYVNRGNLYTKLGNYQKAIKDFDRVIELNPYDALTYNRRGIAYMNLGNYQQAIQDFNQVIKFSPQYIEAYNNRASIYAIIGNYQLAIKDFDMAIKLNPKAVDVYVNRGMLYLDLGNYLRANKDFQIAARLGDKKAQDYLKSKGIDW